MVPYGLMFDKFQVLHIDFVGPLPTTPSGNQFIFTMKDRGTGFFAAFSCPNQTAETAAKGMWLEWVCRFGVPKRVISDRGTQFSGELFNALSVLLGFEMSKTTAYHPQTNGSLERDHKTMKSFFRANCMKDHVGWDQWLPCVLPGNK